VFGRYCAFTVLMVFFVLGSDQISSNISFISDTFCDLLFHMFTHYVIYDQMMKLVISLSIMANSKF